MRFLILEPDYCVREFYKDKLSDVPCLEVDFAFSHKHLTKCLRSERPYQIVISQVASDLDKLIEMRSDEQAGFAIAILNAEFTSLNFDQGIFFIQPPRIGGFLQALVENRHFFIRKVKTSFYSQFLFPGRERGTGHCASSQEKSCLISIN